MTYEIKGMGIEETNERGRFAFAEPLYGGKWAVFRILQNGQGPKSMAAELLNSDGEVLKTASLPMAMTQKDDGDEIDDTDLSCPPLTVRFLQMQTENMLRGKLGLL